ncbi:hypothetical protein GOODEAATRI_028750 [Goodea atripinnis]|uniref:Uncharacterized protein n=1 Tax=Goodea atripinnis TaxID=208336 RepID=A0ABV0N535_9TELE
MTIAQLRERGLVSPYLSMMTGSEGVSLRFPQLFLSQHRLWVGSKPRSLTVGQHPAPDGPHHPPRLHPQVIASDKQPANWTGFRQNSHPGSQRTKNQSDSLLVGIYRSTQRGRRFSTDALQGHCGWLNSRWLLPTH